MKFGNRLLSIAIFAFLSGSSLNVAANAAAVPGEVPAKIGVEVINGPKEVSLETDLGYKVKSGEYSQYKDDFDGLGRALQKAIVVELQDKMGNQAVTAVPTQGQADSASANYIIDGRIDKIRFEGNTLIPNYYELTLSAKMVSTKTGEVVWNLHHKLFAHMYHTSGEGASVVFNQRMAPHVASKIAGSIAHAAQ